MTSTFPKFEKAVERLESFLISEGWPTSVIWVEQSSIKPIAYGTVQYLPSKPYDEHTARQDYDNAVKAGLGVAIEGLAATNELSYVAVTWPKDKEESEYLMYFEKDLKLSLREPRPKVDC